MKDALAGMHNGPWHDTREKRRPPDDNQSRVGVRTVLSPAQPIMSARCWSDMMSTMFGTGGGMDPPENSTIWQTFEG
jgi:hypothetical protein